MGNTIIFRPLLKAVTFNPHRTCHLEVMHLEYSTTRAQGAAYNADSVLVGDMIYIVAVASILML
jgi:hypothetical protein